MIKHLFEIILTIIIIFFVWNILKRIFLKMFYPSLFRQNEKQKEQKKKASGKKSKDLHWDAETIDFEEVKEKKTKEKHKD